jgi:hypothetical protein
MSREWFVRNEGGARRSLLAQYNSSGKLEHFRHYREDLDPAVKRTKDLAEQNASPGASKNFGYEGSVPRIVIHDWLTKRNKTWHQYATDGDLRKEFLSWFRTSRDMTKFQAKTYRERRLTINRATAPRLGKTILDSYRKETENATR